MKHSQLVKIIDLLSFLALFAMVATGVLIEFSLPVRSGPAQIWGLTRHEWGGVHFYTSLAFVGLMSAHLLTHIKYIKSAIMGKASREHKYRIAAGVVGLAAVVLLLVALFTAPVENESGNRGWHHTNKQLTNH